MGTAQESVRECLFAGLDALRVGEDPLLAGLEAARLELRAARALWLAALPSPRAVALCEAARRSRCAELPAGLPPRWLEAPPLGRARLLGPDQLARDPRALAGGLGWALVAGAERGGGRLWIDAPSTLRVEGAWVGELLEALEHLEELAERRERERGGGRLRCLGERAAGVAHDLRNQLTLVELEGRRQRALGRPLPTEIDRGLARSIELCRGFLADGHRKSEEAVPLRPLLVEELEAADALSGRAGEVRLELRCRPELRARGEPELLRRVLRNLLLNAISASPAGARVRLEAGAAAGRVQLAVVDEGRGMEAGELERLLRAGESRGGTGFGTSSVLACLESLAAELEVESAPGQGTRFQVVLTGE